jgi:hypothetical protein
MRFADELRGSEGERCAVIDLLDNTATEGVIVKWDDATQKADVQYDSGKRVRVGFLFVQLLGDESP